MAEISESHARWRHTVALARATFALPDVGKVEQEAAGF